MVSALGKVVCLYFKERINSHKKEKTNTNVRPAPFAVYLLFIGTSKAAPELNVQTHYRAQNEVYVTSAVKVHLRYIG